MEMASQHNTSSYALTYERIDAATKLHNTVFFDGDLNPVVPREGQWFCEFDCDVDHEGEWFVRDEAFVEYAGLSETSMWDGEKFVTRPSHRVLPEGGDCDREPRGYVLIAQ
jgi:hypothetical protein